MEIRRLAPHDADDYRELMLEAYVGTPDAFTATVAEREPMPRDFWEARVADGDSPERVYGAFSESAFSESATADGRLVGVAGLRFQERPRTRHKAWLFGMYVRPSQRGSGLGRELVEAVLDGARSRRGVLLIQLTVSEINRAARELYESCGFQVFGTEPMALRFEDRFVAKVHMWRRLDLG